MKSAIKIGFSFGLTSGIITTLGLMVGLHSGTHQKLAVIGGILTIAIADAFSDAMGIHVSQESQDNHKTKQIWLAAMVTFIAKLVMALTFVIPVIFLSLLPAVIVGVIWGLSVLTIFSYFMEKNRKKADPWKIALEHLLIGLLVILISHFVGEAIAQAFGK